MKSWTRSVYPRLPIEHIWLLGASTQAGSGARAAWGRWQERCQVETADLPSQGLFGMLYAHLIAGLGGPESTVLKGVYKRNWYANQLVLAQLMPLLDRLASNGIQAIVLNDVSLVTGQYPDIGYHAIRCIDLLVRRVDWNNSLSLASGGGWQEQRKRSFGLPGALSICSFSETGGGSLRIWTNLFVAEPLEDTEERTWRQARSLELNGQDILSLGPVEQLLCLSADVFRNTDPPLHLYADARVLLALLASTSDWARLVWQAQRYECILPLRNLLAFLQENLSVQIPSWVLPALHKMAISHFELLQYHRACDSLPLQLKSACLRGVQAGTPWRGP